MDFPECGKAFSLGNSHFHLRLCKTANLKGSAAAVRRQIRKYNWFNSQRDLKMDGSPLPAFSRATSSATPLNLGIHEKALL